MNLWSLIFSVRWTVIFNSFTMGRFIAQVSEVYKKHGIKSSVKVFNLDKTGVSPRRENIGVIKGVLFQKPVTK